MSVTEVMLDEGHAGYGCMVGRSAERSYGCEGARWVICSA